MSLICALCLVSIPSLALADDAKKIVTVKQGAKAPFSGVLYSNAAHALLVARMKATDERYKLKCDLKLGKVRVDLELKASIRGIELDTEKKRHAVTVKLGKQQKDFLLTELKRAKQTPWYRSPVFMFTLGVVLTGSLTVLSVWGVSELKN